MRRKLVVGNWKMNGSLAANAALLDALCAAPADPAGGMVVCAPFPYLAQVRDRLAGSSIAWGAQDCSAHESGAFTVEFTALLLAMGLRSFSMHPSQIASVKQRILRADTRRLAQMLPAVLAAEEPAAVCRATLAAAGDAHLPFPVSTFESML